MAVVSTVLIPSTGSKYPSLQPIKGYSSAIGAFDGNSAKSWCYEATYIFIGPAAENVRLNFTHSRFARCRSDYLLALWHEV